MDHFAIPLGSGVAVRLRKRKVLLSGLALASTAANLVPGLSFALHRVGAAPQQCHRHCGIGRQTKANAGSSHIALTTATLVSVGLAAAAASGRRHGLSRHGTKSLVGRGAETKEAAERKKPEWAVPDDFDWSKVSTQWEVDCFSRPVLRDGKKLWELLLTDSNAEYRRVAQMKPTRVNSVVIQKIMSIFVEEAKVKPRVIRFYRKVMKNMLNVAMTTMKDEKNLNIQVVPSRNCHMLRRWLAYRERVVYPKMAGFLPPSPRRANPVQKNLVQMAFEAIPQKIKFTRYFISGIPLGALARLKPGQLPGTLVRIPPGYGDDVLVYGIVVLTTRDSVITTQLRGSELCGVRVNLDTNELLMDIGLDTTYKVCTMPPEEKESMIEFEKAKRELGGLHFVALHNPVTGGKPNLPIESDDGDEDEGCISAIWLCVDYGNEE